MSTRSFMAYFSQTWAVAAAAAVAAVIVSFFVTVELGIV